MKKRIVVFGATGNIGAYSAVHLKEQGYDVIAVGRRESDNGFFQTKGMDYYSVDIENPESFDCLPKDEIFAANKKDLEEAEKADLETPLLKRLKFNEDKLNDVVSGIESLIGLLIISLVAAFSA